MNESLPTIEQTVSSPYPVIINTVNDNVNHYTAVSAVRGQKINLKNLLLGTINPVNAKFLNGENVIVDDVSYNSLNPSGLFFVMQSLNASPAYCSAMQFIKPNSRGEIYIPKNKELYKTYNNYTTGDNTGKLRESYPNTIIFWTIFKCVYYNPSLTKKFVKDIILNPLQWQVSITVTV